MDSPNQPIQLLTIREVLARLKVSRSGFYIIAKEHGLICKVRGASRVRADVLDRFIENLPNLHPASGEGV